MPQLTPDDRAVPPARGRGRRGITLIELLMTITILAIVGAALSSILTRQQRFYRDAAETVTVRRELRGGASLLPTDLRAISTAGGDLLAAGPTEFTMRATIGSAVVCAKGATSLDLVPTGLTTHTLAAWYLPPQGGDTVFVFDDGTETGAGDDVWRQTAITGVATSATYCAASPYIAAVDDALPRTRISLDSAVSATVQVGAVVRITRPVRYTLVQPTAASDWYLGYAEHTGTAWSAVEPIAGPLTSTNGLQFVYQDTLGAALTPSTPTLRTRVARVGVNIRATGRTDALRARGGQPLLDSLTFHVGVRNFR